MGSQLHGHLDVVVDRISVDKLAHEKQERIRYAVTFHSNSVKLLVIVIGPSGVQFRE